MHVNLAEELVGVTATMLSRHQIVLPRAQNISSMRRIDWHPAPYMIIDVLHMFFNALFFQLGVSTVRLLGRYQGRNGQIEIVECSWDGTRAYFEEGVRQSQATPDGESVFTYVKIMDELLSRSEHILVLGCGGGKLATRLSRLGKRLTIVDINPISFVLAHRYFDLPDDLPCACVSEKTLGPRAALDRAMHHSHEQWAKRRSLAT